MPDITMCKEESCPKKMDCYRYRATPNTRYQSYFAGRPNNGDKCEHFQEIHFRSIYIKPEVVEDEDDKTIRTSGNVGQDAKVSRKTKRAS